MANGKAIDFDVDVTRLVEFSEAYAIRANIGFNDAFRMMAKGIVRRALAITPPASRNAARSNAGEEVTKESAVKLTMADKLRGETAVAADFNSIFRKVASASRRPSAKSLDDIRVIHERLFQRKTPGRKMKPENGTPHPVDAAAFDRFLKLKQKNVGFLAAGWTAGADKLGVRAPLWVRNKGTHGTASFSATGVNRHLVVTNDIVPDKLGAVLQKRIDYATDYQQRAMLRRLNFIAKNVGDKLKKAA